MKAIWSHLVEALLQVWCSHSFSHVSVTGVGQKELPFCCQCSPNVLPAVYIFLTSVHYANITWDRESSNKRWAGWFDNIYHAMIEMCQLKFSNIVYTATDICTSMSGYECFMLFTCENNKEPVRNVKIQDMSKTSQDKTKELSNTIEQRFSIPVLAPPRSAYFAYLSVNTPDSDNQLVRSALHAWTVFRLTCSLHRVYCSLLPEQRKSTEVYFISEHSFMDLRCATSSRMDECDIIYLCKYIQFKFTSCTFICTLNGIYTFASNWNHGGMSCDVHFTGHLHLNRTNIWNDKSNIRNMQSRGARGLELRTAAIE